MIGPPQMLELSLAIGGSLDLRANCEHFLKTLTATVGLSSAAVWLEHHVIAGEDPASGEEPEDVAVLLHGVPAEAFETRRIPLDHSIFSILADQPAISADPSHEHFYGLRTERTVHSGVVTVFKLSRLGFLHLHSIYRQGPFKAVELRQIGEVVAKFTASLEASLTHHRLTREVSLRRRAEGRLQQREEHFRALIENGLDLILVLGYDATISFASPSFLRTLGSDPQALVGSNFFEMVHPEEVNRHFRAFLQQVKIPGRAPMVEMRLHHADGGWRTLAVSSNNQLSLPSVSGIILNCHDVTERKAWTIELEEARRSALEASQAKSAFVANMSHEIRNPLNGVVGMASLLLDSELTAEQRACAGTIRTSADTLATILSDILDFSRVESGKLELVEEPFNVRDCIESTLDMVALAAGAKDLELICSLGPEVPRVALGDPTRFRQVLLNLLSNAVKFTESGEIVVRVRATPTGDSASEIHVQVRDTGIGITPEQAERLFRPFTQADRSTTRRFGGTGLGLAISARLCQLMGGRIWVEPPVGGGAQIDFVISVRIPKAEAPVRDHSAALEGHRIFLVEDNETLRTVLCDHLKRLGMEAHCCGNADEARTMLESGLPPHVALVDLDLPGPGGRAVAHMLQEEHPELPVILMHQPTAAKGVDVSISARLTKPVKMSLLEEVLAKALGLTSEGPSIPATGVPPDEALPPGIKVLVAEDYDVSRRVAEMMLKRCGCEVVSVENGAAAVEAVAEGDFDLVLMDVQMPEVDGFEATRRIHAMEGRRPRIVALTAHATQEDRERCLRAGMDGYLSKPIRLESLRGALLKAAAHVGEAQEFDLSRLAVLRAGGGQEMLAELFRIYLDDLPLQIDRIDEAVIEEDRDTLCDAAHKIRGASANLGVQQVAERAGDLETGSLDADLSEISSLVSALRTTIEIIRPGIEKLTEAADASGEDSL